MMTVDVFGFGNIDIEEKEITEFTTSCGDVYTEAYRLPDGRWIAFEDAISSWVMLG